MMDFVNSILLILMDLSSLIFCGLCMIHFLPGKRSGPLWLRGLAWLGFAALAMLLPTVFRRDTVTVLVLTVYYLAMGWFLYHKSKTGLLYQLIYMFSLYATQIMAIMLALDIWTGFGLELTTYSYIVVILKAVFLVTVTLILGAIIRKRYVKDQKNLKLRGMVLVPVFSLFLIFMYLVGGDVFFARYGYGWLIIFCALVLVINIYCMYFWYDVAANQELKHRLELMEQQNELTHQYYEDMEANYNLSRKIIHDIRNHLHILEQSQKMEKTQQYFADVHEMLNSLGLKFYTDNRMLNIILNDKLKNLSDQQVDCNMGGIRLDFLSDMDITTIFANLLDNAMDAGGGEPDFWLKIRGQQIQDFTVVKIWNSFSDSLSHREETEKKHEGIGLENVRQVLEQYHGELEIRREEHIFSVTLVFPGQH